MPRDFVSFTQLKQEQKCCLRFLTEKMDVFGISPIFVEVIGLNGFRCYLDVACLTCAFDVLFLDLILLQDVLSSLYLPVSS